MFSALRGPQHPLGCLTGWSQNKGNLCLFCSRYTGHLHMTCPLVPQDRISQASRAPKQQEGTTPTHLNLDLCVQILRFPDYTLWYNLGPEAPVVSSLFPVVTPSLPTETASSLSPVLYIGRPCTGIDVRTACCLGDAASSVSLDPPGKQAQLWVLLKLTVRLAVLFT